MPDEHIWMILQLVNAVYLTMVNSPEFQHLLEALNEILGHNLYDNGSYLQKMQ